MMKAGLDDIMQQARQVQENLHKAQEELAKIQVTGEAGAGLVKITMTGKHDVMRVEIDSGLLDEDKDMLEDLVAAAVNDASRKVEKSTQERMSRLGAGLNLPAGMTLPF